MIYIISPRKLSNTRNQNPNFRNGYVNIYEQIKTNSRQQILRLRTVLGTYYKYYKKYNNGFDDLTEKQKDALEEELWHKKALNNPVVFEERYGNYVKEILGDKHYKEYLEIRYKYTSRDLYRLL